MDFFTKYLRESKTLTKKPDWATLCSLAYTDSDKRRYYVYNDEMDMSVLRKGEIEKYLMELQYGSDYSDVVKGMKDSLITHKKGKIQPDMTMLGYFIEELAERKQLLLLPDIMFRIMATMLIREDENPYLVDAEILDEKTATFQNEIQHGGLATFFHSAGILKLLGLSGISILDLQRLMKESKQRIQNRQSQLSFLRNESQHLSMTG